MQVRILPGVLDLRQIPLSNVPRYTQEGVFRLRGGVILPQDIPEDLCVPLDVPRSIVLSGGLSRGVTHHSAYHQGGYARVSEPFSTGSTQVVGRRVFDRSPGSLVGLLHYDPGGFPNPRNHSSHPLGGRSLVLHLAAETQLKGQRIESPAGSLLGRRLQQHGFKPRQQRDALLRVVLLHRSRDFENRQLAVFPYRPDGAGDSRTVPHSRQLQRPVLLAKI